MTDDDGWDDLPKAAGQPHWDDSKAGLTPTEIAVALAKIGGVISGSVITGVLIGWGLDQATGWTPLFVFLGLAFGILGGITGAYRLVRHYL